MTESRPKKKNGKKELGDHGLKLESLAQVVKEDTATGPATDSARIKTNEKGGILIGESELQAAFSMLDAEKSGFVTITNLKKRLGVFFPDLSAKEYRFMMNNRKEMTMDDLRELLVDNDITNFDPVEEAFKLYDPDDEGKIHKTRLKEIFEAYGFEEMTAEDCEILAKAADVDGDGKITLDDFRKMLETENLVLQDHHVQAN